MCFDCPFQEPTSFKSISVKVFLLLCWSIMLNAIVFYEHTFPTLHLSVRSFPFECLSCTCTFSIPASVEDITSYFPFKRRLCASFSVSASSSKMLYVRFPSNAFLYIPPSVLLAASYFPFKRRLCTPFSISASASEMFH